MGKPVLTILVAAACMAKSHGSGEHLGRGGPATQDTVVPFAGTMGPVRRTTSLTAARPALLRAVHVTRETGFDRVVFEFSGPAIPSYRVEYITEPLRACGSGDVVSLAGTRRLVVRLEPAQAHDSLGRATPGERALAPRLPAVLELRLLCDFEGQVDWAVGVAASRRFRVLEAAGPQRLFLDVRHRD